MLEDVAPEVVKDSAFWFVLLRMLVFPTKTNGAAAIYETLLPMLNRRPLLTNAVDAGSGPQGWHPIPLSGDASHFNVAVEALRYTLTWCGLHPGQAEYIVLLLRVQILEMARQDLGMVQALPPPTITLLRTAYREVARNAAELARDADAAIADHELEIVRRSIENMATQLEGHTASVCPPPLILPGADGSGLAQELAELPLFGRFRRDISVEGLIGDAPVPPIQLPIEMSRVGNPVTNHHEAAIAMRDCVELCNLLENQAGRIKNSYLHRVAIIQHLMIRVLPLPLPHNHPECAARCFWSSQPVRYETQVDILRLTELLCRHYAAASLSLNVTRSFDATRMLVMGCLATVADVTARVHASDRPSKFSLHYSGAVPGPAEFIRPYGFEMGYYAVESEHACFTSPELVLARTQVLDYFQQQQEFLTADHVIFKFEQTMDFDIGERQLLEQICLSTGFPCRSSEPLKKDQVDLTLVRYLTNECTELLDNLPEIGFFRDIVFSFKAFMAPSSQALPDVQPWLPSDANLSWASNRNGTMAVRAFGGQLKCAAWVQPDGERQASLWGTLFGGSETARAPASLADPSILAQEPLNSEEDVLHLRHLPEFDPRNKLSPRNCELLLQYLLVPYMRIPLVLQFFADQMLLTSLASLELQSALDACLFEPGMWQAAYTKVAPSVVPSPLSDGHCATPCGLLFNELLHEPAVVVDAVSSMIRTVMELDEGKFSSKSSPYVLYVVRLAVRVEAYINCLLEHSEHKTAGGVVGQGGRGLVRGLDIPPYLNSLAVLQSARIAIRSVLVDEIVPLLEGWTKRCVERKEVHEACVLFAHLVCCCASNPLPTALTATW